MVKAIITILAFLGIQIIVGALITIAFNVPNLQSGAPFDPTIAATSPTATGIALLAANILIALTLWLARLVRRPLIKPRDRRGKSPRVWRGAAYVVLSVPFIALFTGLLAEMLGANDIMQKTFAQLARHPLGILGIVLIGPIVEEIVFREGVLRQLLVKGFTPWWSVAVSALIFGCIHFNPVQIVGGTIFGIVLGWLYLRTGDIRLPALLHVLNNALAVIMLNTDEANTRLDETLLDLLPVRSTLTDSLTLAGALFALALASYGILLLWARRAPQYPGREEFED